MHRAPVPLPDDEPFGDDVPQPVPQEEQVPDPNPEIGFTLGRHSLHLQDVHTERLQKPFYNWS